MKDQKILRKNKIRDDHEKYLVILCNWGKNIRITMHFLEYNQLLFCSFSNGTTRMFFVC